MGFPNVTLPKITGDGFTLRPFAESDAGSLQRHINDPQVARDVSNIPKDYTLADAAAWIQQASAMVGPNSRRLDFVIDIGSEVVGSIAFINLLEYKAQLSYWLNPKYRGRGIMPKAVRLLTQFGFEVLGLVRIFAYVYSENEASARVLQKAGLTFEGVHENEWMKVISGEVRFFDSNYYSIINPAIEKKKPRSFLITAPELGDYGLARMAAEHLRQAVLAHGCAVVDSLNEGSVDLAIAIGGDGTVMRTVREASLHGVPTLGVHSSSGVGFLTSFSSNFWQEYLERILSGKYAIERRLGLRLEYGGKSFGPFCNEITLRHPYSVAMFEVMTNDDGLYSSVWADGVLLSTATGSTAYNMSAGGPAIEPSSNNVVLNMINPTVVNTRAFVTDDLARGGSVTLRVFASKRDLPVTCAADEVVFGASEGMAAGGLCAGESIVITRHPRPMLVATFGRKHYFSALREKKKLG